MCGVPYHAADGYIARLVKKGYPRRHLRAGGGSEEGQGRRQARGRAGRVAGDVDGCGYLDAREPAFLMAIVAISGANQPAVATTASRCSTCRPASSTSPIHRARGPAGAAATKSPCCSRARLSSPAGHDIDARDPGGRAASECPVTEVDGWHFDLETARQTLLEQLRVSSLEASGSSAARRRCARPVRCCGHLRDTQKAELAHVRSAGRRARAPARPSACRAGSGPARRRRRPRPAAARARILRGRACAAARAASAGRGLELEVPAVDSR